MQMNKSPPLEEPMRGQKTILVFICRYDFEQQCSNNVKLVGDLTIAFKRRLSSKSKSEHASSSIFGEAQSPYHGKMH